MWKPNGELDRDDELNWSKGSDQNEEFDQDTELEGSWESDQYGKSCPYTPSPEFKDGGSFWKNLKLLLSQMENPHSKNRPVESSIRIREWNGEELVECSVGKDDEQLAERLEEIAEERQGKAQRQSWDGKVKWIHLPSNDMGRCVKLLMALCRIAKPQVETLLSDRIWWDQLDVPWDMLPWEELFSKVPSHTSETEGTRDTQEVCNSANQSRSTSAKSEDSWKDKPVDASFMDAAAFHIDFDITGPCGCWSRRRSKVGEEASKEVSQAIAVSTPDQRPLDEGTQQASDGNENHGKKSSALSSTVLYMPYLHYDSLDSHMKDLEQRQRGPPDWAHNPRRSLDEAADRFFTYSTLAERNRDQVVTRFLRNLRKKNGLDAKWPVEEEDTIMVVDQLWLWILDKDTLLTCFPGDYCEKPSRKCPKLHLECLALEQIKRKCCDGNLDAERLASHIIYRSYSIFTHRHLRNPNFRFIDIFERSISEQRASSTDLFRALEVKKKTGSFLSKRSPDSHRDQQMDENYCEGDVTRRTRRRRRKDVFNLQEDIEAVGQVRDIDEELHIMLRIIDLQMHALGRTRLSKWEVWKEDLTKFKDRLEGLSKQTKDINELLIQTLELKQAQLSVRQNQVVLIFTVVTIVFLPLGFISSIFGMNATELSDGSPVGLRRMFTYMFTIGIFLSGFALAWAFEPDIADGISIVKGFWYGRKKDKKKEMEEKRSLWHFGRKKKGSRKEDPYP